MGESLISLLLRAPLIGVDPATPDVLHAVTMDGIPIKNWPNGEGVTTACGLDGLKLAGSGEGGAVPWPPRVASLPKTWTRCRACFDAARPKRPRSSFRIA